ncbi:Outer membrane protein A precursor [Paraburkholderia caribensis MBA4]|uniref:Outer membrane protein A n=1 Tax=Paraburkholderia caribensis MBA4 TaxID=1323664 RepID=A0A0P0RD31_9BURK|nr:OmpA family protein [Paraburkholderia caribensis]ALL66282.1 Outer membrane protein A precursor [Paraburkholderia caribensis MBA4]
MTKPTLRRTARVTFAATLAAAFAAPAFPASIKSQAEALMPAAQKIADPYRRGVAEGFLEIAERQDGHVLVSRVYNNAAQRALGNARNLIDQSVPWEPLYTAKNWPTRDKWVQAIRAIEATNARASASTCKSEQAGRLLALTDEVWKEQDETHGTRWVHGWDAIERAQKLSVEVNQQLDHCAPPPPKPVVESATPISLSADALFDFDSAKLNADGTTAIDGLAADLKRAQSVDVVTVIGYTDRFGSVAHNRDLSRRRAQAVADALKERGLTPTRFDVRGAGSTAPIATCPGRKSAAVIACLAPNRRVEIRVSGQSVSAMPVAPAAPQSPRPQPMKQEQPQQQSQQLPLQQLQQPPQRQQWQVMPQSLQKPPAQ